MLEDWMPVSLYRNGITKTKIYVGNTGGVLIGTLLFILEIRHFL